MVLTPRCALTDAASKIYNTRMIHVQLCREHLKYSSICTVGKNDEEPRKDQGGGCSRYRLSRIYEAHVMKKISAASDVRDNPASFELPQIADGQG